MCQWPDDFWALLGIFLGTRPSPAAKAHATSQNTAPPLYREAWAALRRFSDLVEKNSPDQGSAGARKAMTGPPTTRHRSYHITCRQSARHPTNHLKKCGAPESTDEHLMSKSKLRLAPPQLA